MARGKLLLVAVLGAASLAACGGGSDGNEAASPTKHSTTSTSEATDTTLDESPFCVAVRALETLGKAPATGNPSPARVLEQNAQLAGLIDDATNNAPQDAPADVRAMFDDYRLITKAVVDAAGDMTAAMAALSSSSPELMTRLSGSGSHSEARTFLVARCGPASPG